MIIGFYIVVKMIEINDIEEKSKKVGRFLRTFPKEKTAQVYKSVLKNFFNFINEDPDKYVKDVHLLENGEKIAIIDNYERGLEPFLGIYDKEWKIT